MSLTADEYHNLIDSILKATEEGQITLWTERIAQLAKKLELPTHLMRWSGSPQLVADQVIIYAESRDKLDQLRNTINSS